MRIGATSKLPGVTCEPRIGIDLGTTSTYVANVEHGTRSAMPNRGEHETAPSDRDREHAEQPSHRQATGCETTGDAVERRIAPTGDSRTS